MSLNKVYSEVPLEQRICEGCGNPIQRNVAILNGKLYHWGCLKKTKALPTHRCLDCFGFLTRAGMNTVDFGNGAKPTRSCSYCGGTNLKKIDKWYKEKYLR